MCMKKFHAKKTIFGLITAYQACLFCMAFVFLILVFFIDHYCVGVSNKHCALSFFFHFTCGQHSIINF